MTAPALLQDDGSCGNKQISVQSLHTSVIIIGTILSNITLMLKVCGKLLSLFCITQFICLSLLLYTVITIMLNVKDIHVILEEHLHASALCGGNVKPTTKTFLSDRSHCTRVGNTDSAAVAVNTKNAVWTVDN